MSVQVPRAAPSVRRRLFRLGRGQVIVLALVFLASFAIGYRVYQQANAAPATQVATAPVTRGSVTASVAASGTVVTTKQAKLSFGAAGRLKSLAVNVGDPVTAGQTLAEIDTASLEIKLEQAKSSLRVAETKLRQLKAGAKDADVAAARAAYESAVAKYNDLAAGPTAAELKSAEQAAITAEASLQKAEKDLAALKAGLSSEEVIVAKAELERKQAALAKAQGDYDKVAYRADITSRPEALALQQATIDYQAALANYTIKTSSAKPEDIAIAEKGVESARAALLSAQEKLAQVKAGPKAADLEAARSSVASARASLAGKTDGATAEDLLLQEEQIKQAQISVRQAELDLANAKIVAPFDGVVSAIGANVGEQVGGGTAMVTVLDPKAVRVDATVDESDVARIAAGKTAQITFDAIPNERFEGRVVSVAPSASVQQGVVTYLVSVQLEPRTSTLPAGMTANVTVTIDRKDNVLTVPNRAIRSQGRNRVVEVEKAGGGTEMRPVRVGLSGDQVSEILEGVSEGESVVVSGTSITSPRTSFGAQPNVVVKPAGGAAVPAAAPGR